MLCRSLTAQNIRDDYREAHRRGAPLFGARRNSGSNSANSFQEKHFLVLLLNVDAIEAA